MRLGSDLIPGAEWGAVNTADRSASSPSSPGHAAETAATARAWLTGLGLTCLSACTTLAPTGNTELSGRIAVRVDGHPERSLSAGFELSGDAERGRLVLTGPLGATAAQAAWSPGRAWLDAGQGRQAFVDLDALADAALGERVPMAALFDWLRARPWPGSPHTMRVDGMAGFDQLGWRIDLSRWAEGWIEARRAEPPVVTVRARLERP